MKVGSNITRKNILSRDDRKTSEGYVDVKSKTINQLIELIERQNKLLQNRYFLDKLPDKGEKIKLFKAELETELKKKQEECDETCQLMVNLNLKDKSSEEIEWNEGKLKTCEEQLDSDDEESREVDPLKILVSHSGTVKGRKIKDNFSETKDLSSNENTFYVNKICEKYEKPSKISFPERFKPNQLRNNDRSLFKISAEKLQERLGDKWEVTQATPPAPIFKDTVMISLKESLKLLEEQAKNLEEIEKKNATEKLLKNMSVKIGDKLPIHNVTEYRTRENVRYDCDKDSEETESNDSDG